MIAKMQSVNILRGLTPIANTFDTNPSNLERITDGDLSTETGVGSKVMSGAGNFGYIKFDLGTPKTVLFGGRVSAHASTGTVNIFAERCDDDVNYTGFTSNIYTNSTNAKTIRGLLPVIMTGRYIQIRLNATAASTCSFSGFQLFAYDLGMP
jgi:hypothetical protein